MLHAAVGIEEEAGHVLTVAQVHSMGHRLLGALLQLQHYGAIDKTAEGFQMVIKRCSLHFRACSKHVLHLPKEQTHVHSACSCEVLMPFGAQPAVLVAHAVFLES